LLNLQTTHVKALIPPRCRLDFYLMDHPRGRIPRYE
jgi:hypothetical protein